MNSTDIDILKYIVGFRIDTSNNCEITVTYVLDCIDEVYWLEETVRDLGIKKFQNFNNMEYTLNQVLEGNIDHYRLIFEDKYTGFAMICY